MNYGKLQGESFEIRIIQYFTVVLLCFCGMFTIFTLKVCANETSRHWHEDRQNQTRVWESMVDTVPIEERDCIVAYGDNRVKEFYLISGITPCLKYYMIQSWIARFSDTVRNDIHDVYRDSDVKWILVTGDTSIIDDVLEEKYEAIETKDDFSLYHLINSDNK